MLLYVYIFIYVLVGLCLCVGAIIQNPITEKMSRFVKVLLYILWLVITALFWPVLVLVRIGILLSK